MGDRVLPVERAAVVTGVGTRRGIGREVARALASQGWSLGLIDRDRDGLSEFSDELHERGVTHACAHCDITSEESVWEAYDLFERSLPPIIGLANLAGVACPKSVVDISTEEWLSVMNVNVTGTFLMSKRGAVNMMRHGVGRIVNTSSITAFDGGGTFSKSSYAAAKAAVLGLTRGTARELGGYGITVNAIAPGPIDTDIMGGALTRDQRDRMSAGIPVSRIGNPRDIADAVAFLMSDSAGYISGATIQIDGGKYMH